MAVIDMQEHKAKRLSWERAEKWQEHWERVLFTPRPRDDGLKRSFLRQIWEVAPLSLCALHASGVKISLYYGPDWLLSGMSVHTCPPEIAEHEDVEPFIMELLSQARELYLRRFP